MWTIVSTWAMSEVGVREGAKFLDSVSDSGLCTEKIIANVENNPDFDSVGFGGFPNEQGEVESDAAFMDGNSLTFGAVTGLKGIANPIKVAKQLSTLSMNNFLSGLGAMEYARENGFEEKELLTEKTYARFSVRSRDGSADASKAAGNDTVGTVCLDRDGTICAGTSTTGLMLKKRGRVSDSALPGAGLYADSDVGGAVCTGLGEEIMKGCLAYEAVRLMKEGRTAQQACEESLKQLALRLKRNRQTDTPMAIIAVDKSGTWGAATVDQAFSFVVATAEDPEPRIFVCRSMDEAGEHIQLTQAPRIQGEETLG